MESFTLVLREDGTGCAGLEYKYYTTGDGQQQENMEDD